MNHGSEDVNVVVIEDGVTCKDEAQNGFSVDPSLVRSEVVNPVSIAGDGNVHTGNLDGNGDADKAKMKFGVQEVDYGNGVMDDKSVKEFEAVDTSKIPEFITTDNRGTDEVKLDAYIEGGDNARMDIDNVSGWKDEIPDADVISGAGKDDQFDVFANFKAEQGLPEPSGKDKELIVYGRRATL
ncbi:hypothetical protein Tco_1237770 [Tanacetum coccineum]